jgi:hypothetical protein
VGLSRKEHIFAVRPDRARRWQVAFALFVREAVAEIDSNFETSRIGHLHGLSGWIVCQWVGGHFVRGLRPKRARHSLIGVSPLVVMGWHLLAWRRARLVFSYL